MISIIEFDKYFSNIRTALEHYYKNVEKRRMLELSLKQVIHRPFSSVAFYDVKLEGECKILVAKKVVHHEINYKITSSQNQAVVEFDILVMLSPKFANLVDCSVPKPIIVLPEIETYVMEFAPGELLTEYFKYCRYFSRRSNFNNLVTIWFNCGRWLRYFQEFTGKRSVEPSGFIDGVLDRAKHRLSLIALQKDKRVPVELQEILEEKLEKQTELLADKKIMVSGRHGDFIPLNMIANGSGICVIDFLGYREEPVAVDLFKVIICLSSEMNSLTANPRKVAMLKKVFLNGYGPFPDDPQPILYICEAMQRIVNLWANISKSGGKIHHRYGINRCIKQHVDWLMKPIK